MATKLQRAPTVQRKIAAETRFVMPCSPHWRTPRSVLMTSIRGSRAIHPTHGNTTISRPNVSLRFKDELAPDTEMQQAALAQTGFRNIVLALDMSAAAESDTTVEWTVQNLLRKGDHVHLFHITPAWADQVFAAPGSRIVHLHEEEAAAYEKRAAKDSGVLQSRLVERYGERLKELQVEVHAHVVPMHRPVTKTAIGQALCDKASGVGASVVVMASRSHGGLISFIRGSVADFAARHCESPVAVLHSPAKARRTDSDVTRGATPGALTGVTTHPRQLVVAVDSSDDSVRACQWILDNLFHPGDTVHLVHVVPCLPLGVPTTGMDFLTGLGVEADEALLRQQRTLAEGEVHDWMEHEAYRFHRLMEQAGADYKFDVSIQYTDDPVQAISSRVLSKAEEVGAAAVVLTHHDRPAMMDWCMGSVANDVLHHSASPVVLLHTRRPPGHASDLPGMRDAIMPENTTTGVTGSVNERI